MSPTITINPGGPDIAPGVYPVVLVDIMGPRTIVPQTGPNAGQEIEILDWAFAIDGGDLDGTPIDASTSTRSGPRSKLYAWLTALLGQAPGIGQQFEAEDLKGRQALATIGQTETGWPRIEGLTAVPLYQGRQAPGPAPAAGQAVQRQAAVSGARTSVGQAPGLRQRVQQPVQTGKAPF